MLSIPLFWYLENGGTNVGQLRDVRLVAPLLAGVSMLPVSKSWIGSNSSSLSSSLAAKVSISGMTSSSHGGGSSRDYRLSVSSMR